MLALAPAAITDSTRPPPPPPHSTSPASLGSKALKLALPPVLPATPVLLTGDL